jgi:hypothetical protein
MFKATKVDNKLIEPEFTYKAGVDVMMMRVPSYWSRLGSSNMSTVWLIAFPIGDSLKFFFTKFVFFRAYLAILS